MRTCDVLIIGAGSVGLPLAYYCARAGMSVVALDREASWGRGQNRAAIGGIRATHSDPAKIRICRESIDIVSRLREEEGLEVEWRRGGYLFVAYDEERERGFRDLLGRQRASGLDIDWIGPDRVRALAPGIEPGGLRGGTWSPEDGCASPLMTATAFHLLGLRAGVDYRFGEGVISVSMRDGRLVSLRTNHEEYSASLFVNAAGADAAEIASLAGVELPVQPDSHEAGVSEPVARFLEPMIVDMRPDGESGNYYFYQAATGQLVFCVTPKPLLRGKDERSTSTFLPLIARRLIGLYPRLRNLKLRRTWRGLYPMTPDGLPLVGYPRKAANFLQAVGMCGQGFMIGPGLGRMLATTIAAGGRAERPAGSAEVAAEYGFIFDELSPYRRFEEMELLK